MEKKRKQNQEGSVSDAYSLFVYAIRTQITRDYYLRRLRSFFDFIKLLPNAKMEHRCNHFAALAIKDHIGITEEDVGPDWFDIKAELKKNTHNVILP